jgi:hypothetical protein
MKPGRTAMVALSVFALCAVLLAIYVGSYLGLARTSLGTMGHYVGNELRIEPVLIREYPQKWQVQFFAPLGILESWLRRQEVDVRPRPPSISL